MIGTGLAKGAAARGKKIAFGDGRHIIWGPWCAEMFANNPNIARPGEEHAKTTEWCHHYKGNRLYNQQENGRWLWNMDFRVRPGELFFDEDEKKIAQKHNGKFIVIEPNVPWWKPVAPNKDWGEANYNKLAKELFDRGCDLVQFKHRNTRRIIPDAKLIEHDQFRKSISVLSKASLYVGPEGGMHHAAAAVGVRAVVLFGGFIPPEIMGYKDQINLTGGATACGNIQPCIHCKRAMEAITVDDVLSSCMLVLKNVRH